VGITIGGRQINLAGVRVGIWINILKLGAEGYDIAARELLEFELPLALRQHSTSSTGLGYTGPLASVVSRFISTLPESERDMARSRADDLVSYVLVAILAQVRRSLLLVEFCHAHPDLTLEQIAECFTGWEGLKRSARDRLEMVANYIGSMIAAEIPLPPSIVASLGSEGEAKWEFNEAALASKWDTAKSWLDLKRRQELDCHYKTIDDSSTDSDPEAHSEGLDFGLISMAEVALSVPGRAADYLTSIDFRSVGRQLGPEITETLGRLHDGRPTDGYRPIAWHNVIWNLLDDYSPLEMELRTLNPEIKGDQALADHISANYLDVLAPNRLKIQRRRGSLNKACREKIFDRLIGSGLVNNPASRSHM
jgi:hypothetical protein